MTLASLLLAIAIGAPSSSPSTEPVLLDFHAEWCGPCRQMRKAVAALERGGYPIKSIDIDQAPDLKEKYGVDAVPTFIVVDAAGHELGRTSGSQPAAQLAKFYQQARAKAQPPATSRAQAAAEVDAEADADDGDTEPSAGGAARNEEDPKATPERDDNRDEPAFENPKPWETVVRIRVLAQGSVGFGSGTVIHSSSNEALILTCAHIFKLDGQRQVSPGRFPRKIMVDLFDGKLHGQKPAQVHFVETIPGQALDYDFSTDVGLIRIRPGRRLPAARVVPAHWHPQARMLMYTVGCSEGQDATAWSTVVLNPRMRGLSGNPNYEAIECKYAPKQGRSGGGLFTQDGYIAGVCNFAEPRGDHGLYATPRSIYGMLDRNKLMALYAPVTRGSSTLLASRGNPARGRGNSSITVARAQSPDGAETEEPSARRGALTVPPPELVIKSPLPTRAASRAEEGSTRRMAWHPTHPTPALTPRLTVTEPPGKTEQQTALNLDPQADHDRFSHFEADEPSSEREFNSEDLPTKAASPVNAGATKSRWRPARSSGDASHTESSR